MVFKLKERSYVMGPVRSRNVHSKMSPVDLCGRVSLGFSRVLKVSLRILQVSPRFFRVLQSSPGYSSILQGS